MRERRVENCLGAFKFLGVGYGCGFSCDIVIEFLTRRGLIVSTRVERGRFGKTLCEINGSVRVGEEMADEGRQRREFRSDVERDRKLRLRFGV